jgi:hypothetical protein
MGTEKETASYSQLQKSEQGGTKKVGTNKEACMSGGYSSLYKRVPKATNQFLPRIRCHFQHTSLRRVTGS